MELPFQPDERSFLRQVALPVIEQFLSRIHKIRSEQEQQQWERFWRQGPGEAAGPSSGSEP